MYFNCKNCTDRKLGCHGVCEDYIKISKERAEKRKKDRMLSTYKKYRKCINRNKNGLKKGYKVISWLGMKTNVAIVRHLAIRV